MGPNLSIKMRISIGNNRFANVEYLVQTDVFCCSLSGGAPYYNKVLED